MAGTIAQGLYKTLAYKKQTGLGTPASGSGAVLLRRETAMLNKITDTYDSNEIVSHQMDTGVGYGISKTQGELNDVISAGSFAPLFGSLLRTAFASVAALTGLSLTIAAGSGGTFTITATAGPSFLGSVKVGNVVRITAGTYTGVAANINLLVTAVTGTVLTVIVPNGSALSPQGPITASTITVVGKTAVMPTSGQLNDYYTIEEWFADVSLSRLYTDVQIGSAEIQVPATGNAKVKFNLLGLGRSKNSSQQLTGPTAAPTTAILASSNAKILIAGAQTLVGTSLNLKIDGQLAPGEAVIGSTSISDNVKGDMRATGSFTILKQDEVVSNLFDNQTGVSIICVMFADATATSDFVSFIIPLAKVTKDEIDDGKKQLIETHDFVGQYNQAGGTSLANDTAIISMQDSAA